MAAKRMFGILLFLLLTPRLFASEKIDRVALVNRHNVKIAAPDAFSPLSVGNGHFAFTADITGLQTFPDYYRPGIPLATMAEWGWHSFPNTKNYKLEDSFVNLDTYGRNVPYDINQKSDAGVYLRTNPHQTSLVQVGFEITKQDGTKTRIEDVNDIDQTLDLWRGILTSRFSVEGKSVEVETLCHPVSDQIAVRVKSLLLKTGQVKVLMAFPYASGSWGPDPADWEQPQRHVTSVVDQKDGQVRLSRQLDDFSYGCVVRHTGVFTKKSVHIYCIRAGADSDRLDVSVFFSADKDKADVPTAANFEMTEKEAVSYWKNFWSTGGAIDLSGSKDARWKELERRIILSRYLTTIQSRQKYPPQETGLTCNSWFGKFHLEMHWWHQVHFPLWGDSEPLEKTMRWYQDILPQARKTASRQGYKGVRWPKMTSPGGEDAPSGIGALLIWQQPHPIYYAELLYRQKSGKETLEKYRGIVFETAEFMADFAHWDQAGKRYVLGPPVIPAQENYKSGTTRNPTYELCYWYWGLETAQQWRVRLGLERRADWDRVIKSLSALTVRDGVYTGIETEPYTNLQDHPSMVAALGLLPKTPLVDPLIMAKTAQYVYDKWDWPETWGWDYPMLAMTAARVGKPGMAVDALLIDTPKNRYFRNGHNYQRKGLPIYLPGNGGLLTAVAMMAAGWDGCEKKNAPGFPDDGQWVVKWEDLKIMP
jgi:hypothetical protein